MLEWEWYDDTNVKIVFLHLLLSANFKENVWKGQRIGRGQLIIGKEKLGSKLGLTISQIKTVFSKLQSSGEIAIKGTSKNTLVTLVNFDVWQKVETENNQQDSQQIANNLANKSPQRKNEKKEEEKKKEEEEDFDPRDMRVNKNLPFDIVSSSQTIKATFEGNTKAIDLIKEAYGVVAVEQDIKTAMHTFSTVAIASYDNYRGIRDYTNLCNKFIDWVTKSITYEKANKGAKKPKSSFYNRNNNDKPATFSFNQKVTNG